MTDDEFEAACDDLMALIDADGSSACIADRTLSIDLHDWQVPRLIAALKGLPGEKPTSEWLADLLRTYAGDVEVVVHDVCRCGPRFSEGVAPSVPQSTCLVGVAP